MKVMPLSAGSASTSFLQQTGRRGADPDDREARGLARRALRAPALPIAGALA
jgi:hypothetical protein